MPDSKKPGTARPRVTIEATAREVGKKQAKPSRRRAASKTAPPPPEAAPDITVADQPIAPGAALMGRLRALVPALVAASITALVAVIVVFSVLAAMRYESETTRRGLAELVGAEAAGESVGRLGEQVAALTADLDTLKAGSPEGQGTEQRLDQLEGQLATLQTAFDRLSSDLTSAGAAANAAGAEAGELQSRLGDRLERIETQFVALDTAGVAAMASVEELRRDFIAAAESGASAAAVATRLAQEAARIDGLGGRVGGVEQTLSLANGTAAAAREAAAQVSKRQEALESRVGGLETSTSEQTDAMAKALGRRLDTVEALASTLGARLDGLGTPGAIAVHSALAAKAAAGEPFTRELAALRSDLGALEQFAALAPYADRAVPTSAALIARLAGLPVAVATDDKPATAPENGLLSRLLERAGDAVTVRRRGVEGSTEISDAAGKRLAAGDVGGAIAMVGTLPVSLERDRWLADAAARRALDDAVSALGAALDARLAASGNG